jgi:hypothetical protein
MAEADSADETTGTEQTDEEASYAWASQQPTTRIRVDPNELIYSGDLDETVAQNDTSFALQADAIEVINGTVFENDERDEYESTSEAAEEQDQPRATDFRVVDVEDESANAKNDFLFTREEMGDYTVREESIEEETLLFFNGMSGQFIGRTLDFNGLPWARYTDEGYLVKGLLQVPDEWRSANRSKRSDMAKDGRAPRVTRTPFLREDVDEIIIDLSRYNGGRMYEVHVFDGTEIENPELDLQEGSDGMMLDGVEELQPRYDDEADDYLADREVRWAMYHGAGWPDEPANAEATGSVDVELDVGGDEAELESGFTASQERLIDSFEDALKGSGVTPDGAFDGGLEAAIETYAPDAGCVDNPPETSDVREELYVRLSHLDVESLED